MSGFEKKEAATLHAQWVFLRHREHKVVYTNGSDSRYRVIGLQNMELWYFTVALRG